MSAAATLEPHEPFRPVRDDVELEAKRLAGQVAQRLTTYEAGTTADELAAEVPDGGAGLRTAAAPLVNSKAASRGRVVYPQLGGLTARRTSVMVVVEQELSRSEGSLSTVTRTLDVRLERDDAAGAWRFDRLASAGGDPVARPDDLSQVAADVVDDGRIELPDTAKWDIYAGRVKPRVLEAMDAMADRAAYGVAVLRTGHPVNVFDTDKISNHTRGLAVDLYAVDGELVVDQRDDGSPAWDLARWLYDDGLPELGSPWAFDGHGGRSFTDPVHQDHLHVGLPPNP